jgi:hypothetical protein
MILTAYACVCDVLRRQTWRCSSRGGYSKAMENSVAELLERRLLVVGFEVFTAVTMKSAVF